MPDDTSTTVHLGAAVEAADRFDAALGGSAPASPELAALVSLTAEIRRALGRPLLGDAGRARIHARAVDMAERRAQHGSRLSWPQLAQLGTHPAVVGGGVAAAALAVVGLAVLRERRGHGAMSAA